jgi:hypothetical protein
MSDRGRYGQVGVGKQSADADDRFSCVGKRCRFGEHGISVRILGVEAAVLAADRFGLAGEQRFRR